MELQCIQPWVGWIGAHSATQVAEGNHSSLHEKPRNRLAAVIDGVHALATRDAIQRRWVVVEK